MGDPVIGALTDPDADGLVEGVAAVVDLAVLDDIAGRPLRPFGADLRLAQLHATGGQVVDLAPGDHVPGTAAT